MSNHELKIGEGDSYLDMAFQDLLRGIGKVKLVAHHLQAQSEAVPNNSNVQLQLRKSQILAYLAKDMSTLIELYGKQIDQLAETNPQS